MYSSSDGAAGALAALGPKRAVRVRLPPGHQSFLDIAGPTGLAISAAILHGERDPRVLRVLLGRAVQLAFWIAEHIIRTTVWSRRGKVRAEPDPARLRAEGRKSKGGK